MAKIIQDKERKIQEAAELKQFRRDERLRKQLEAERKALMKKI